MVEVQKLEWYNSATFKGNRGVVVLDRVESSVHVFSYIILQKCFIVAF